jgi:hypothetical protein
MGSRIRHRGGHCTGFDAHVCFCLGLGISSLEVLEFRGEGAQKAGRMSIFGILVYNSTFFHIL